MIDIATKLCEKTAIWKNPHTLRKSRRHYQGPCFEKAFSLPFLIARTTGTGMLREVEIAAQTGFKEKPLHSRASGTTLSQSGRKLAILRFATMEKLGEFLRRGGDISTALIRRRSLRRKKMYFCGIKTEV